jgi:3-dehydroquinate synthase
MRRGARLCAEFLAFRGRAILLLLMSKSTPQGPMSIDAEGIVTQQFSVPFSFTVAFTRDVFGLGNGLLANTLSSREPHRKHKVLVVLDDSVNTAIPDLQKRITAYFAAHEASFLVVAKPLVVPGGERAKNDPSVLKQLLDAMQTSHLDRQSFVLMIGGGAVLDVAGYAAAITHRGLRTVRLPSTVLGQNDSGVGVKNGVNAYGAKNFWGTFHPPFAVINDFSFLDSLPDRERIAGYAEAIKVSLIRDLAFFCWLEKNALDLAAGQADPVAQLVRRAAELHLRHIGTSGDPFEQGSARPLDFGHWSAHKLESLTNHELRHGEAVALGVLLDTQYSVIRGQLPLAAFERVANLIANVGLPTWHPALERLNVDGKLVLLEGLEEFREHLGGDLTVTLLTELGRGEETNDMDPTLVAQAIWQLRTWNQMKESTSSLGQRAATG